jgi:NADP-dependent 3-hydroxy acid dehydrogenase YdfG
MKELIKKMPFLKSEDIADSVLYVLSTAPHVQVRYYTVGPK